MGRLKRPRKPATLVRYLRQSVNVARSWNNLDGHHWLEVNQNLLRTQRLIAELSRAIATSGKAPGRP